MLPLQRPRLLHPGYSKRPIIIIHLHLLCSRVNQHASARNLISVCQYRSSQKLILCIQSKITVQSLHLHILASNRWGSRDAKTLWMLLTTAIYFILQPQTFPLFKIPSLLRSRQSTFYNTRSKLTCKTLPASTSALLAFWWTLSASSLGWHLSNSRLYYFTA